MNKMKWLSTLAICGLFLFGCRDEIQEGTLQTPNGLEGPTEDEDPDDANELDVDDPDESDEDNDSKDDESEEDSDKDLETEVDDENPDDSEDNDNEVEDDTEPEEYVTEDMVFPQEQNGVMIHMSNQFSLEEQDWAYDVLTQAVNQLPETVVQGEMLPVFGSATFYPNADNTDGLFYLYVRNASYIQSIRFNLNFHDVNGGLIHGGQSVELSAAEYGQFFGDSLIPFIVQIPAENLEQEDFSADSMPYPEITQLEVDFVNE